MKKKKIELARKLFFNKTSIMSLSVEQQQQIHGGINTHQTLAGQNQSRCGSCPTVPEYAPTLDSRCYGPGTVFTIGAACEAPPPLDI